MIDSDIALGSAQRNGTAGMSAELSRDIVGFVVRITRRRNAAGGSKPLRLLVLVVA